MAFLLKSMAIIMVILLIGIQLVLISPYGAIIRTDNLNGDLLSHYQTIISKGFITLNLLGEYTGNSAALLINGRHIMPIGKFPVRLELTDGDVVEIHVKSRTPTFHVYLAEKSNGLYTDMKESTLKINPGMNRILSVNIRD